jgi:hypothetical protein
MRWKNNFRLTIVALGSYIYIEYIAYKLSTTKCARVSAYVMKKNYLNFVAVKRHALR